MEGKEDTLLRSSQLLSVFELDLRPGIGKENLVPRCFPMMRDDGLSWCGGWWFGGKIMCLDKEWRAGN